MSVALSSISTVVAVLSLALGHRAVRDTTARAAWCWAIVGGLVVGGGQAWILLQSSLGPAAVGHLRYLGATLTLLPLAAILGARRPHELLWPLVVVGLWVVLLLPAAESALFRPEKPLDLHLAWRGLLALWLVVGLLNFVTTSHRIASVLATSGQLLLLARQLPPPLDGWLSASLPDDSLRFSLGLMLLATGALLWSTRMIRPAAASCDIDRAWLDYRDLYGAQWGLRLVERFNQAADHAGWPVRLTWHGLRTTNGDRPTAPIPPDLRQAMWTTLDGHLRRFVMAPWMQQRQQGRPLETSTGLSSGPT